MQDNTIECHNCGSTIAISEVLRGQMRQALAVEQQQAIRAAAARAEQQAQERLQHELQTLHQQVTDQQSKALQDIALLQQQLSSSQQHIAAANSAGI